MLSWPNIEISQILKQDQIFQFWNTYNIPNKLMTIVNFQFLLITHGSKSGNIFVWKAQMHLIFPTNVEHSIPHSSNIKNLNVSKTLLIYA